MGRASMNVIDQLIDHADMRCTLCNAPAGTCQCWVAKPDTICALCHHAGKQKYSAEVDDDGKVEWRCTDLAACGGRIVNNLAAGLDFAEPTATLKP